MRWVLGTALVIGLAGLGAARIEAWAQPKPPPLDPPAAPAPGGRVDKFGEPIPDAPPPALAAPAAPPAAPPAPEAPPALAAPATPELP
ncbi:hypothetical protein E2C06_33965, partial [Dankookia rubra]